MGTDTGTTYADTRAIYSIYDLADELYEEDQDIQPNPITLSNSGDSHNDLSITHPELSRRTIDPSAFQEISDLFGTIDTLIFATDQTTSEGWSEENSIIDYRIEKKKIFDLSIKLRSLEFPAEWRADEIQQPNEVAINNSVDIADKLFRIYNLVPKRKSASAEEGILLFYWDSNTSRSLNIEAYNTGEIVGLVNHGRTILACVNIDDDNNLGNIIGHYLGR